MTKELLAKYYLHLEQDPSARGGPVQPWLCHDGDEELLRPDLGVPGQEQEKAETKECQTSGTGQGHGENVRPKKG